MKLQVIDEEGNILKQKELSSGSSFGVYYNGAYGVEHLHSMDYIKFDEKHVLRQSYVKITQELCQKYSVYLYSVFPHQMAFVVDEAWEPSEKASKNSAWKIDISKAPAWMRMTTGYEYMIKMRQHWLDKWSEAQLAAAIMSQLLRINPEDGNIFKYTEDFQSRFVATFGIGYLEPKTVIPNLLTEEVRIIGFKEASGQITMDELPAPDADELPNLEERDDLDEDEGGDDHGDVA